MATTASFARADTLKNRVYLRLEGFHDEAEARRMRNAYRDALAKCRPGLTVLADFSAYKPGSPTVQKIHEEAAALAAQAGVRRVARVVGATPLGGMQIERVTRAHAHYEVASFETVAEAEAYLDEP